MAHPWNPCLEETDLALLDAALTLQPSWDYLFYNCDVIEDSLSRKPSAGAGASSGGPFKAFVDSARLVDGGEAEAGGAQPYGHVAFVLDALVRFKLCLPEKSDSMEYTLAPTMSVYQTPPSASVQDVENTATRERMLRDLNLLPPEPRAGLSPRSPRGFWSRDAEAQEEDRGPRPPLPAAAQPLLARPRVTSRPPPSSAPRRGGGSSCAALCAFVVAVGLVPGREAGVW